MNTTITTPAPVETVTEIKPSEALRLGRLLAPLHATGYWYKPDGSACALGAIHLGWGGSRYDDKHERYDRTSGPLWKMLGGTSSPAASIGSELYDAAERRGEDGDAAVLAYLEERGL